MKLSSSKTSFEMEVEIRRKTALGIGQSYDTGLLILLEMRDLI